MTPKAIVIVLGTAAMLTAALVGTSFVGCAPGPSLTGSAVQPSTYRSPFEAAFSGKGLLAVSDRTAQELVLFDAGTTQVSRRVSLRGEATGLAWSLDSSRVYVSECGAASVAEVEAASGKILRRLAVGAYPMGLAVANKRGLLLVADSGRDQLCAIELSSGKVKANIPLVRQPQCVAVTPDESQAVVTNLLPTGDATGPNQAANVSLVNLEQLNAKAVALPSGSVNARGVRISPDGRWAYVAHTMGKYMLPTTQLDRGWVNTNALSILDLKGGSNYCTVLLDMLNEGAADPWGLAISKDGSTLWVSLAGAQQVARLDLGRLHPLLEGKVPKPGGTYPSPADAQLAKRLELLEPYRNSGVQNTWMEIAASPAKRELLACDLTALHVADVIQRVTLPTANGPRGLDLSPDGASLAVTAYFSSEILVLDGSTLALQRRVALGASHTADDARRGEMIFHDGTYCFQHWMSCSSCHPNARVDGLNWDLLNDGIGNPKNVRSMLLAHRRGPMMSHGIRADMPTAVAAGFKFILFRQPQEDDLRAVQAYIRSLTPLPSPRLVNGRLSEAAQRGKKIFESQDADCSRCHSGELMTDLKVYEVGTAGASDTSGKFIVPTMVELWRTAPYLHDGSAPTMRDVLTSRNKGDQHGVTSKLTPQQIDDLSEYLLSQ